MKRNFNKITLWGKKVCEATESSVRELKQGTNKLAKKMKSVVKMIAKHRETLAYYAVLALVLFSLGMGAHDYRTQKSLERLNETVTTEEPHVAAQAKHDPTMEPTQKENMFILPIQGTIIEEFTDSELIWSTTMQLWQTHPAIDIAASAGEAVIAAADGTIIEAYDDGLYGNVLVIEHGAECTIRYASLNTIQMVEIGQKVKQGEVISSVGNCMAESDLGAHVHIECFVNQKPVDFLTFVSESSLTNLQD